MREIRKKKLESAILKEISRLIERQRIKDDRIGLHSVTAATLLPDFSLLRIFISPFDSDENNRLTLKALLSHQGFFQSTLSRNLHLRQTPRIEFKIDTRIKEGDDLLDKIEQNS